MLTRPRLLLLVTEDWYFWSHRLDLARAARDAGFTVCVATRVERHGARIEAEGFTLYPIRLMRRSRRPLRELSAIAELVRLYRRERPDIVHHVAMKPILYGSCAARMVRIPAVVNAFAGLGHTFIADGPQASLTRFFLRRSLQLALSLCNSLTIFQNKEDRELLIRGGLVQPYKTRVIRGSGVDTNVFTPSPIASGELIVMLASRMLWDKGVGEFVEAVRLLKQQGLKARFALVGQSDEGNPASLTPMQISRWREEGLVECWGHHDDMPKVLASATVVVLPSYREGLPKVLLEAAACGRPLVATDVPGCREIARDGINGLLVPPRDPHALARAIARLVQDAHLRAHMGARGREIAVSEFSVEKIVNETLAVYSELLGHTHSVLCSRSYA